MTPKELIKAWVGHFNNADYATLSEMYHHDAINHQVTQEPVEGKAAIKEMFRNEFENASMLCIIENIFEDGEWGILEWKDPKGLRGCGFFQIIDEKIRFQRGYWDKLSFLRIHDLPIPIE